MKKFLFIILLVTTYQCHAQKYILLDTKISASPFYSNKITPKDKIKGFFPVEKKDISKFLAVLEEISVELSAKKNARAKNYLIGCIKFRGITFNLANGPSLDYTIISTCDGIKMQMHLCDGKLSKADNAYFVNTWIKYIKAGIQK